jgi:RHS repeat-associated protein
MISREGNYLSHVTSTRCPNDDYDALNRPRTWEGTSLDARFALSNYRYDQANREIATWRWEDLNTGERFTYEPTNQIATALYGGHSENVVVTDATRTVTYSYPPDKLNRSTMTEVVGSSHSVTNYSPNELNQYTNTPGHSYSYDANFNLTLTQGFNGVYDAANRLVSASNGGSLENVPTVAQFVYDGLGRCVKRTFNEVSTVFIYDGWKPIGEFDAWNTFKAWNLYGPGADEILLRQEGKYGYLRFHTDRHGNVTFLLNENGEILERVKYDAFGQPTVTDSAGWDPRDWSYYGHPFLFQGREYIRELGIYDFRNRYYLPSTGRFLQSDPMGFTAGDMNLFRYCGDGPVDGSDPLGLIDKDNYDPTSLIYRYAEATDLSKFKNYFSYSAHGSDHPKTYGQALVGNTRVIIPTKDVISAIKENTLFARKVGTLLLVCNSGAERSTLAKSVAAGTGKDVLAPNKYLWYIHNKEVNTFVIAGGYRDRVTHELKLDKSDPGCLVRYHLDGTSKEGAQSKIAARDAASATLVSAGGAEQVEQAVRPESPIESPGVEGCAGVSRPVIPVSPN